MKPRLIVFLIAAILLAMMPIVSSPTHASNINIQQEENQEESQGELTETLANIILLRDIQELKNLIAKKNNTNKDIFGVALMIAANTGYKEGVQLLLDAGVDVNFQDEDQHMPTALGQAMFVADMDVIKTLIAAKADPNITAEEGFPLFLASLIKNNENYQEIMELLLAAGADPNLSIKSSHQSSAIPALMVAITTRNKQVVKSLLAAGANPNPETSSGITPCQLALMLGETEIANMIKIAGGKYPKKMPKIKPIVRLSREQATERLISLVSTDLSYEDILTQTYFSDKPNIIEASREIKELIKMGADVNAKDEKGNTVLMNAIENNHEIETIKLIIDRGADLKAKNNKGQTALHIIAKEKNPLDPSFAPIISANINTKNNDGETPLITFVDHFEAGECFGHFVSLHLGNKILEQFLLAGADINAQDSEGYTALAKVVSDSGKHEALFVKTLLNFGASVTIKDNEGKTVLDHINGEKDPYMLKLLEEKTGLKLPLPEEDETQK